MTMEVGMWLRAPGGQRFRFDAGRLCLAFATTGGQGARRVYETLHESADLVHWLASSSLRAEPHAAVPEDLAEAKRLREAIWLSAARLAHGQRLRPEDFAVLNVAAAHPPLVPRIEEVSGNTGRSWARPITVRQALSEIARDAIDLFTGSLAARIRECAGPDCALIFVDTSRPGARRWCSMERCGNRAKVRAHRRRAPGPTGATDGRHTAQSRRRRNT